MGCLVYDTVAVGDPANSEADSAFVFPVLSGGRPAVYVTLDDEGSAHQVRIVLSAELS